MTSLENTLTLTQTYENVELTVSKKCCDPLFSLMIPL